MKKKFKITIKNKILFLFLLYVFSMFYVVPSFQKIGFIALVLILIVPIVGVLFQKYIVYDIRYIFILIIASYYLVMLVRTVSKRGTYNCILQLLIIIGLISISFIKVDYESIISIGKCFKMLSVILIIYNIILFLCSRQLDIDYDTYKLAFRNTMYGSYFIGMYVKEYSPKKVACSMLFLSFLMMLLRERTMAMGAIIFECIFLLLEKVHSKKIWNILFVVFSVILIMIPLIYVGLYTSSYADHLNQIVGYYTHKNLFSGRQAIWALALERIGEQKWLGYGLGNYMFSYTNTQMSVHNLYLFILLQGGILNLALIFLFMYFLFHRLMKCRELYFSKLAISSLFMLMFLADFGLILFANDIQYSVILWTTVGLGLLRTNKRLNLSKDNEFEKGKYEISFWL